MKTLVKNKKGIALNQAFGAVLVLVLVAVLVIVAIVLFANLEDTFTNLESRTIDNETVSSTIGLNFSTAVFLTQSENTNLTLCNGAGYSGTIWNASDVVVTGNYTIGSDGSIIRLAEDSGINESTLTVDYTFNWGGPSCVATNNMITQFATYPTLIGLVGTIIFLGLVIGVLVASFVFGRKKEGF